MSKKYILFAIFIYTIFPVSSVLMKYAALNENFLFKILLFGLSIGTLGIFSILWQTLLKKVDLIKAYIFKSTTIIWSAVYGVILFNEQINFNMVIGMIITMIGIMVIVLGDKKNG